MSLTNYFEIRETLTAVSETVFNMENDIGFLKERMRFILSVLDGSWKMLHKDELPRLITECLDELENKQNLRR